MWLGQYTGRPKGEAKLIGGDTIVLLLLVLVKAGVISN